MPSQLMWTCPRCGKAYVTRHMSHSCVRVSPESHFVNRPRARELFEALRAAIEAEGPVTVSASKTRVEFMTRARFVSVYPRRDWLRLTIWLKERVDSPRFARIDELGRRDVVHVLELRDESEIDDELRDWLRRSRAIGDQRAHRSERQSGRIIG